MLSDDKINLLARVARTSQVPGPAALGDRSILTLAAASYGSRPTDESTIPTGFDPVAAALFESIIESAYLVATADGVFDDDERAIFERIITTACGGTVPQKHVADLVADFDDQLGEDGIDLRLQRISEGLKRPEHAREALRIAALIAQASEDVSAVERSVLERLARACKLASADVDAAFADVKAALT